MIHNAIHVIKGKRYHIQHARLREIMPHTDKCYGNPLLWFAKDMINHDWIVCGLPTLKETLSVIENELGE